jgi:cytochrome P450
VTVPEAAAGVEEYDPLEEFTNSIVGDERDPYPGLAQARRETPIVLQEKMSEDEPDSYMVFRFEDVTRVLRDGETFSSTVLKDFMGPVMGDDIILGQDEPEHHRYRSLVAQAFMQSSLARWEQDLMRTSVDEQIDKFADRGRADLVRELTAPFPVKIVAGLLGLPREDYTKFLRWSFDLINVATNWDRGVVASEALRDYFAVILEERRRHPQDDVISILAQAEYEGERLTDDEIFSFLRLLLPAGAETTYRASGNLLYGLFTHPEQYEAVKADRSLLPRAIEEGLRWEPPLLITSRRATTDVELAGTLVKAGSHVTVNIGAANRDETRYPNPDEFDLFRDPAPHAAFGTGVHMCLGMHLARMETRVALDALFDRLPNLRLDPEADDVHIHGGIFRSPMSLPVVF